MVRWSRGYAGYAAMAGPQTWIRLETAGRVGYTNGGGVKIRPLLAHTIHGASIFTYLNEFIIKNQPNVGKYNKI